MLSAPDLSAVQGRLVDNAATAAALLGGFFDGLESEEVRVAHLDQDRRIIALSHTVGTRNAVDLPLAQIIRDACLKGTKGLLLAHNHPSGDPTPSDHDKTTTRKLAELARLLDIHVVDHLIFAAGQCVSLRGLGVL